MKKPELLAIVAGLSFGAVVLSAGSSWAGGFQTQSFSNTPASAPAAAPPNNTIASVPANAAPFSSTAPEANMVQPDYVIGPEDTIQVDVFDVPNLSRTVQVNTTGQVLLPLLGQVNASGQTADQLSMAIQTAYGDRYLQDPKVTVTIKDSASRRVTVDGAVMSPGIFPITNDTTLMKAIAMAKGPDMKLANTDKVAIFRVQGQTRTEAVFDLDDIRDGKAVDPQIMPNDIVVVDTSAIRRFFQDISPIAPFAALGAL